MKEMKGSSLVRSVFNFSVVSFAISIGFFQRSFASLKVGNARSPCTLSGARTICSRIESLFMLSSVESNCANCWKYVLSIVVYWG